MGSVGYSFAYVVPGTWRICKERFGRKSEKDDPEAVIAAFENIPQELYGITSTMKMHQQKKKVRTIYWFYKTHIFSEKVIPG